MTLAYAGDQQGFCALSKAAREIDISIGQAEVIQSLKDSGAF